MGLFRGARLRDGEVAPHPTEVTEGRWKHGREEKQPRGPGAGAAVFILVLLPFEAVSVEGLRFGSAAIQPGPGRRDTRRLRWGNNLVNLLNAGTESFPLRSH